MLRFALALVVGAVLSPAAETWTRVQSSHFELFTTAGEKRGREAILYFEQVRSFFLTILKGSATPLPVRIIGFSSEKEYRLYRPSEFAAAYYLGGHDRDYIVMGSLGQERFPVAVHEYIHLLIRHSGLKLPIWLNEGLAELYSTMKPVGKKVQVGDLIPGRFQTLLREKWLPLATLTRVDHDSPLYNEKDRAGMLYAESWALVHMLWLDENYRPEFGKLVQALHAGLAPADAFQKTYSVPMEQVEKALQTYLRGNRFYAAVFDVKLEKSAEQPEVSPAEPLDIGLSLAHLRGGGKSDAESAAMYEELAAKHSDRPEPVEALGYMALRSRDDKKAIAHMARASELGSKDPKMYWDYAVLLQSHANQKAQMRAALEKTLELNPNQIEARLMLGYHLIAEHDYRKALNYLRQIKSVTKEQAPVLFRSLAYASAQVGDREQAITAAKRLVELVKPEEKEDAERLLRFVSRNPEEDAPVVVSRAPRASVEPSPPVIESKPVPTPQSPSIAGKLQHVECLGKQARLVLAVNGRPVRFLVDDPAAVQIRGREGISVEFTCGPQKSQQVVIEYEPQDNLKLGTAGVVRVIEFKSN